MIAVFNNDKKSVIIASYRRGAFGAAIFGLTNSI